MTTPAVPRHFRTVTALSPSPQRFPPEDKTAGKSLTCCWDNGAMALQRAALPPYLCPLGILSLMRNFLRALTERLCGSDAFIYAADKRLQGRTHSSPFATVTWACLQAGLRTGAPGSMHLHTALFILLCCTIAKLRLGNQTTAWV